MPCRVSKNLPHFTCMPVVYVIRELDTNSSCIFMLSVMPSVDVPMFKLPWSLAR